VRSLEPFVFSGFDERVNHVVLDVA
jgi:hypothetical protein